MTLPSAGHVAGSVEGEAGGLSLRLLELRRAFDRTFAEPRPEAPAGMTELLAVRVGGEPYALALSAVAGVFAGKKLTPLPGAAPELLGLAGFRASLLPVYDLRVMLGYPGDAAPRWLVAAAAAPVALAFDEFEGYRRVAPDSIVPAQEPSTGTHVRELLRDGGLRHLLDVDSVIAEIRRRVREESRQEQQQPKE